MPSWLCLPSFGHSFIYPNCLIIRQSLPRFYLIILKNDAFSALVVRLTKEYRAAIVPQRTGIIRLDLNFN
jgi:hypothetical protein